MPEELDIWLASRSAGPTYGATSPTTPDLPVRVARPRLVMALVAVVVLAASLSLWHAWPAPDGLPRGSLVPLTTTAGIESSPSFAPTGDAIAFVARGSQGRADVFVSAGSRIQALTNTPVAEASPAYSPDGLTLAFLRVDEGRAAIVLHSVADGRERTLGYVSAPEDVLHGNPGPYLAWMRDGRALVVMHAVTPAGATALHRVDVEDGRMQPLTTPPSDIVGDADPAVSPDGRTLVFVRNRNNAVCDLFRLALDREGAAPERLLSNMRWNHSPAWLTDSRTIVFSSGYWGHVALWRMEARPGATPERISAFGEDGFMPAVSHDGRIAYLRYFPAFDVMRLPLASPGVAAGPGEPFVTSNRLDGTPHYAPDGTTIVFAPQRSGSQELWLGRSDGGDLRRLTEFGGPPAGSARFSPDGTSIAFDRVVDGQPAVYIMDLATRVARRLTDPSGDGRMPEWSLDGRWVFFASRRSGREQIWKAAREGGAAMQVTEAGGFLPRLSPDGRYLYYIRADLPKTPLLRMPAEGGAEEVVVSAIRRRRYAVTLDGIYFGTTDTAPPSIAFLSHGGDGIHHVVDVPDDAGSGTPLSVSPDGRWLAFTVERPSAADLMLVQVR